jgi:UDPglucose--hexose-1-phosphate uridylyltransferase
MTGRERDEPRIVIDESTGRPVLVAPDRRHRPVHTAGELAGPCPFCPGEEHRTPPEVDAVRDGTAPDAPGWRVRAFPNLYPAARWHEVVVEGPAHAIQPAVLDDGLWHDALVVQQRRIRAIEARPDVACAFLFKNVGRLAGASIAHNHSQILGLPMLPPRLVLELAQARAHGCAICADLRTAAAEDRVVSAGPRHVVLSPRTPKLPFETWLVPIAHGADFLDEAEAADLAVQLARLFVAIDLAFDGPAFNSWLHRVPGADFHWHIELQPRTGFLAGLELGGDMYINSILGPESAAELRAHLPR